MPLTPSLFSVICFIALDRTSKTYCIILWWQMCTWFQWKLLWCFIIACNLQGLKTYPFFSCQELLFFQCATIDIWFYLIRFYYNAYVIFFSGLFIYFNSSFPNINCSFILYKDMQLGRGTWFLNVVSDSNLNIFFWLYNGKRVCIFLLLCYDCQVLAPGLW